MEAYILPSIIPNEKTSEKQKFQCSPQRIFPARKTRGKMFGIIVYGRRRLGLQLYYPKSERLASSNRNQIVFTIFRSILEHQTDAVRLLFQINRKMVNTI